MSRNGRHLFTSESVTEGHPDKMNLRRPIYTKTAAFGHFGRTEPEFTWEKTDKAAALKKGAGL